MRFRSTVGVEGLAVVIIVPFWGAPNLPRILLFAVISASEVEIQDVVQAGCRAENLLVGL